MRKHVLLTVIVLVSSMMLGCIDESVITYECPDCNSTLLLYNDGSFYARQDMPIEGTWTKDNDTIVLVSSIFSWRLSVVNSTTLVDQDGDYWTRV